MTERKRFAEIDGEYYQAVYPFCAGCPELVVGGFCGYEGNGCRFPDKRITRPISMYHAYFRICKENGWSPETKADELGKCAM